MQGKPSHLHLLQQRAIVVSLSTPKLSQFHGLVDLHLGFLVIPAILNGEPRDLKMPSPIMNATLQAAMLSTVSNLCAQVIEAYRNQVKFLWTSLIN
jgi:hypothetical protein